MSVEDYQSTLTRDYQPVIKKLPAHYQANSQFLEPFLRAFEEILLGLPVATTDEKRAAYARSRGTLKSIRQILSLQAGYFDAGKTPPQFLEWLSAWVGYNYRRGEEFNHPDDNTESAYETPTKQHIPLHESRRSFNRFFIARMVSVYRNRGTSSGIKQIINDYLHNINYEETITDPGDQVEIRIDEYLESFVLGGDNSCLGQHSILGVPRPHYFRILILTRDLSADTQYKLEQDIVTILNEEKPAHVIYYLTIQDIGDYLGGMGEISDDE